MPFEPNKVQQDFLDEVAPGWRKHDYKMTGKKAIVLKARKEGITTCIAALFFLDSVNNANTESVVIAHDLKTTEMIFRIIKRFWEKLPDHKRPEAKYASKREFYWPGLDSSFFVGTAGAKEFGRGLTPTNVHGSEVAFWPGGDEIVAGLLEAVPEDGNVFLESTANGLGNYFQEEWESAENGQSVFKPLFYPWFIFPEYTKKPEHGFKMTEGEAKLAKRHKLTAGQIAWRRDKAKALKKKLPQEHPSDAAEAFISSGNPYFDREALMEALGRCTDPGIPVVPPQFAKLCSAREESLRVWKYPEDGRRYVVDGDPAEGLDDKGDPDFCSADVLDADTWEQVATLHGRWGTHEFGMLLAELGHWYNTALLGIERNNHGHAVLDAVIHTAGYPLMGQRPWGGVYCHEEFDVKKATKNKRPGWPTTPKTKYLALDGLEESIAGSDIKFNSAATVRELVRYVHLPGGKAGGDGGSHDDRVMSIAVGIAVLRAKPKTTWAQSPSALEKLKTVEVVEEDPPTGWAQNPSARS